MCPPGSPGTAAEGVDARHPQPAQPQQQAADWPPYQTHQNRTLALVPVDTFDEMMPGQTVLAEYQDNQQVDGPLNDTDPVYTGQQRKWMMEYLRQCADLLLLNAWTLRLSHDQPDDDVHASVYCAVGRYYATFKFHPAIFTMDPTAARQFVTHELLHVMYEPAAQVVEHDLKPALAPQSLDMFLSSYRRTMEYATDHLSLALCGFLPLPPWAGVSLEERTWRANLSAQTQWREHQATDAAVDVPADGDSSSPATT